ncbi:MAG: C39 family peptidase [Roseburia sp.]|nr:C39 family peptidase [Roseburia sp.]
MANALILRRKQQRRRRIRLLMLKVVILLALAAGVVLFLKRMYTEQESTAVSREANMIETLGDEIVPGKIPMFFQFDERWKDEKYGDGTMEFTGCGPVCLSMVLCGLNGTAEYDPVTVAKLADAGGYYTAGAGSLWTLMSEGAERFGLTVHSVIFDEEHIRTELLEERPVICIMGPGEFTTTGHFIVLCGIDEDGLVIVHDPNSEERSKRGWEIGELMPQIRNLWSYT